MVSRFFFQSKATQRKKRQCANLAGWRHPLGRCVYVALLKELGEIATNSPICQGRASAMRILFLDQTPINPYIAAYGTDFIQKDAWTG